MRGASLATSDSVRTYRGEDQADTWHLMFCCPLISLFWSSSSILEPIGGPICDPRYTSSYIHTKTKLLCIGESQNSHMCSLYGFWTCQLLCKNCFLRISRPKWKCPYSIFHSKQLQWVPGVAAKQLEHSPPEKITIWIDRFSFQIHAFQNWIDQSI